MKYMILINIVRGVRWFLNILSWLIIANALLSWFMDPTHPIRSFLMRLVEPIVRPFRRLTSRLNTSGFPIDFSPLFAYFAILILLEILSYFESYLFQGSCFLDKWFDNVFIKTAIIFYFMFFVPNPCPKCLCLTWMIWEKEVNKYAINTC